MPAFLAASITSVPGAASTCCPSIVSFTRSAIHNLLPIPMQIHTRPLNQINSLRTFPVQICTGVYLNAYQRALFLVRTRLPVQMVFKLVPELLHDRNSRHRRRVAQRTEGPPEHVLREVADQIDVALDPAALMEPHQDLPQPGRALPAG